MTRILFLACHLAGSGHLVRTMALARAVEAAGGEARVISGGRPLAHPDIDSAKIVQIPPLSVEGLDFSRMLTSDGTLADATYMAGRTKTIEAAIRAFRPAALVTETFPLGRRRLAAEFEAAITGARSLDPQTAIIASLRDVPEPPSSPARLEAAIGRLRRLFDLLVVHGDAGILPLSVSWPLPPDLEAKTVHAGYIGGDVAEEGARAPDPDGEVLVSVGGGDRGRGLLELAARAAYHSPRRWRLLVGGADAAAASKALSAAHPVPNLCVEPVRADYRLLLSRAAVSVSLAGYNTVMDLAPIATPAILVPDETAGEREQAIRAAALARHSGIASRALTELTPEGLGALAEAMAGHPRPPLPLSREGATRAADLILKATRRKSGP